LLPSKIKSVLLPEQAGMRAAVAIQWITAATLVIRLAGLAIHRGDAIQSALNIFHFPAVKCAVRLLQILLHFHGSLF
jgi:hypothetical protein